MMKHTLKAVYFLERRAEAAKWPASDFLRHCHQDSNKLVRVGEEKEEQEKRQ